jgi:hypothetical protein
MRRAVQFLFIVVFLVFLTGCGSQSSAPAPQTTTPTVTNVPVSLTVTDTPPSGVTVLFFQLSITGATLSPGNVPLLSSTNPIPVNVSQLQADTGFLGNASVPAGTYTGLNLTFGPNSQLTIFNNSGATIGSGANACATNTVCILMPTTTNLSLSFTTAPFPVTLAASTPLALKLDIHLDTVIQSDLSVNLGATNGVTIDKLAPPAVPGGPMTHLGHLIGTVQSIGTNQFTLLSGEGRTFTIGVNSSTTYDYPSSVCSTSNFACLAAQQIVKVEVSLLSDGTLLASDVDYEQAAGQTVVEGNIIRLKTSGGNTLMDLILQKGPPTPTPNVLPFGHRVTVTVPPTGVTYAVDAGTFTIPSGLTFASLADLVVGQQVQVVVQGSVSTASGSSTATAFVSNAVTTFTTNSIKLEPGQITGSVAAINAGQLSFTLSTMPHYFIDPTPAASTAPPWAPFNITVDTTTATNFLPTTLTPDTIMGLKVNDVASVKGWIFSTPSGTTTITLAGETVLDRGSITPLF